MSKISEYPTKAVFNDTDLYDCSTNGTVSEAVSYADLKDDLKNTFHTQGGNSYGSDLVVGTNDSNDVVIETNGTEAVRVVSSNNDLKTQNAIQAGTDTFQDAAQFDDIAFKVATLNPSLIFVSTGSWSIFPLTGFDTSKIVSVQIFIDGADGRIYPPNHTKTANSEYEYRITSSAIEVRAETSETNIDNQSIKFLITYTD